MTLEHRNGRVYYYTSERVGRTVVKRYRGSGPLAQAAATLDALARAERKAQFPEDKDRVNRLVRRLAKHREWLSRVSGIVGDALTSYGWHQHHRGEWRRKRGVTMTTVATTTHFLWHGPELAQAAGAMDPTTAEKAAKGDRSVIAAVDAFLDQPAAIALWGDMGRRVLQRWVKRYSGSCLTTERALLRFAADLRDRLAGPDPDALVQLVAERVVIAWVMASYAELRYEKVLDKLLHLPAQQKMFLAEIELANRHLLSACRTLAKVKKANLPGILALVNVAPTSELKECREKREEGNPLPT
jgi:hypothetical protein